MAVIDDPTQYLRPAGTTSIGPTSYAVETNPYLKPAAGYTPTDWTKVIQGNSGYMNWALSAAERNDVAAANRTAALRALAIRYGGLPSGFQDPYRDIDEGTLSQSQANPLSESKRLAKSYADGVEQYKRSLAARNALQSGDLGYGLGEIDYQRASNEYESDRAVHGRRATDHQPLQRRSLRAQRGADEFHIKPLAARAQRGDLRQTDPARRDRIAPSRSIS
jgi:hypothetical protein